MTGPVTLQITGAEFLAFCTALGHEREAAGAGPGARIGIGQRADALQIIAALNASDGWLARGKPPGAESAEAVFAKHLAPVLCETPAMRASLRRVLARDRVPGTFRPVLPHLAAPPPQPDPDLPPDWLAVYLTLLGTEFRWRLLRLKELLSSRRARLMIGVGGVAAMLALAAPGLQRSIADRCLPGAGPGWPLSLLPLPGCEIPSADGLIVPGLVPPYPVPPVRPPLPPTPNGALTDALLGPLHRALTVLEGTGFDRSPAQLAEHLATTSPVGLDPALYLDSMLSRWPLPADRPIPRSRLGALAVVNFGLAAAELEGDAGALAAIRERLSGLTQAEAGSVTLPGGLSLPDNPMPDDETAITIRAIAQIDPRLARFAVDEVMMGIWSLTPIVPVDTSDLFGTGSPPDTPQGNFLPEPGPRNQDLRPGFSNEMLTTFAAALETRFGVSPGFDPSGAEPVTLNGIATAIRAGLEEQAPLESTFQTTLAPWRSEVDLVVLLPPLVALLWAVLGFAPTLRRQLARWPKMPPPQFHLAVPAPDRDVPALAVAARTLAQTLRYTPPRTTASLDVEASLGRTLRQGGYFAPVLRTRRDVAAHVVLIHRRTMAEHEPRRIAALLGQLQAVGVSMALFEYAANPARLRPFGQRGGPVRHLDSLLQDYPDARLIVVTTGDEFTGAGAYGASAASVKALRHWAQRAVVTPVPVGNWGMREWALSAQLDAPLARAAPDGLPDLASIFPSDPPGPVTAPPVLDPGSAMEWLRKARAVRGPGDPTPPLPPLLAISEAEAALPQTASPDRLEAVVASLRRWLGPHGYLWLQACASYPVLRYPLTRWLGERLFGEAVPVRSLAQLSLLGWFAVGRMPAGLAARLRRDLSEVDMGRIEGMFTEFFARHVVAGPSPAQDAGRGYASDRIAYEPDPLRNSIPGARQLPAGLGPDPAAEAARLRQVRRAVLADRGAVVAAAGLLSAALWAVWPDRTALPLPPGAWLPVATVGVLWVAVGSLSVVALAALRRARTALRRARPQPERQVAT